ncbi:hypothetical protein CPC16_005606 [Podila verticillata]|nr:hypothetical protein CPC16_005606 [Podila verticillata]
MNISTELANLTLSETRKCPRCGKMKNILEDFHKGASSCKECRKLDYNEKKGPTVKNSDLVALVTKLALKVEKLERALKRPSKELSDDEDEPVPKKVVKVVKDMGFGKGPPFKSKSDVDTGDDESDGEMLKRSEKPKKNKKVAENSDEEVDKPKEKTSKKVSKKPIGMPSDVKAMLAKRKK